MKPADGKVLAGRWSVDEAPDDAVFAVNAGQFTDQPWGWMVQDGVERQAPGRGPLAPARRGGWVWFGAAGGAGFAGDGRGIGDDGVPVVPDAAGGRWLGSACRCRRTGSGWTVSIVMRGWRSGCCGMGG